MRLKEWELKKDPHTHPMPTPYTFSKGLHQVVHAQPFLHWVFYWVLAIYCNSCVQLLWECQPLKQWECVFPSISVSVSVPLFHPQPL